MQGRITGQYPGAPYINGGRVNSIMVMYGEGREDGMMPLPVPGVLLY